MRLTIVTTASAASPASKPRTASSRAKSTAAGWQKRAQMTGARHSGRQAASKSVCEITAYFMRSVPPSKGSST